MSCFISYRGMCAILQSVWCGIVCSKNTIILNEHSKRNICNTHKMNGMWGVLVKLSFSIQNIITVARHIKAVILSIKSTQIFHENVKFSYTVEPV